MELIWTAILVAAFSAFIARGGRNDW